MKHAIIRGKEVFHILSHAQGGNQVREHLRTVDTPPQEGVIGVLVKLVPGQLGGHEVVNAAFLHQLGQRAGVTKHVRQPQHPIVHPKLLPEEAFAVDKLPD